MNKFELLIFGSAGLICSPKFGQDYNQIFKFLLAKKWDKNYICFRKRKKKKKTRNVISPMNR